ncbi:MAG: UDP-glucose/GDP-mannose dehydrogenase family protein [Bdellovibrionaceae bacterium]|nr:UDP-glucose/GDP-mannose dehydrogenase family protein [Pseudobdellovibrionaceae bacterium]
MKITVIGSGYVGLVTGACLAEIGHQVMCFDVDKNKISTLREGKIPIYEPGLDELVVKNIKKERLLFTDNVEDSVAFGSVQFIAVGTPSGEDGSADLNYVLKAAENIGKHMAEQKYIINKSTVPVGTAEKVKTTINAQLKTRGKDIKFDVISNPEFLKEGAAIDDFMKPARIIIGIENQECKPAMEELYAPFQKNHDKIVYMDVPSAELTKYAANCMLAVRISFMNELSRLAEVVGADIDSVRKGIGSDPRIGFNFLYAGVGYGGSCFPKDVKALIRTGRQNEVGLEVVEAAERANKNQKKFFGDKVKKYFGSSISGKKIAVWGLAFKPNTDDMREAPSLDVIADLETQGCTFSVFDPVSMTEAKKVLASSKVKYCQNQAETLDGADALIVFTEWSEFKALDFEMLSKKMKGKAIFDGRNIYDGKVVRRNGFEYFGIGKK